MESWRLITQQAADNGWSIWKFDLKTAFLQGIKYNEEEEVVYWNPPEFFRKYYGMGKDEVCVALKSVYGLNDAPRRWYEKLAEAFMHIMGMERHWLDPCLFQLFEPATAKENAASASEFENAASASEFKNAPSGCDPKSPEASSEGFGSMGFFLLLKSN